MSSVYLVGVQPLDLKGPERLEKFLGFTRPDCICLETSKQCIETALANRKILQNGVRNAEQFDDTLDKLYAVVLRKEKPEPDVEERELRLEMEFSSTISEYGIWVPEKYREQNPSTTIVPVYSDETVLSFQRDYIKVLSNGLMDANEDFKPQFMREFATAAGRARLQEEIDVDYSGAGTFFANHPESKKLIPLITGSDDHMEMVLRKAVEESPNRTTVLVCGTCHFFGDYENNLYERVKDLSPVRVKLPEVDEF